MWNPFDGVMPVVGARDVHQPDVAVESAKPMRSVQCDPHRSIAATGNYCHMTDAKIDIYYGVSNNARTFWSITNARRVIDYRPEDDSEVRFAEGIARLLRS